MSGMNQSHATGDSAVPGKIQERAPVGLEQSLPDSVHDTTGSKAQSSTGSGQSHATDVNASKVPVAIQKAVPESLERALPESIHPTGDKN